MNIPRTTLKSLLDNEAKIREDASNSSVTKRKRVRTGKDAEVEEALIAWFKMAPAKNIPITGSIMLEKASQSAEKLEKTDFKAIGC